MFRVTKDTDSHTPSSQQRIGACFPAQQRIGACFPAQQRIGACFPAQDVASALSCGWVPPGSHPPTRLPPPLHPARRPGQQALPCLPCLPARPPQARRHRERCGALCRPRPPATAVCVGCKSTCNTLQHATHPSNILHNPPKFYVPHLIFYVPHLIFCIPPSKLYVNLNCGAVDNRLAWPLPLCVVSCGVEPPFLMKTLRGTQNIWGGM